MYAGTSLSSNSELLQLLPRQLSSQLRFTVFLFTTLRFASFRFRFTVNVDGFTVHGSQFPVHFLTFVCPCSSTVRAADS